MGLVIVMGNRDFECGRIGKVSFYFKLKKIKKTV